MTGTPLQADDFRREAESIFSTVRESGVTFADGTIGRFGYGASDRKLNLKTRTGLYCGQIGIAVYFAAMYTEFGDELYQRCVEKAVTPLLERAAEDVLDSTYIGAGCGAGSVIYGLSLLSELTGERRYRDRAEDLVAAVSAETIAQDEQYDLLLGAAGTTIGLLRHWERTNDREALDKAVRCGEHLLANRYDKWGEYKLWDTSNGEGILSTSTGMGHGVAGISYALYRLYHHTGREEFREAADNAISFENLFYSEYENNWKANFSGIKHYSHWWCYGLVGIGNARLGSLQYYQSETLERDLRRVTSGFSPHVAPEDPICHGTFAQIDFLLELGREFDTEYIEKARQLAAETITKRRRANTYRVANGSVDGITNPVLFVGTAGIGYTILRLLRPDSIPSILRFE
ncbi:lanthionine synthetase LanC family protein [Halopiger djelfimassiliensis]|uniref:lanthionine synthetase LanC family protein n=1 Tax=Halopiger djelfimassiliensis TaxID=1293047 RepID=UPI0006778905|nr:lanthionine synthetase LanC family protein [Halopiger djelfimassiliensis]